jgi:hypothetical protein
LKLNLDKFNKLTEWYLDNMFAKIESILLSKVTKFFIYTLLGLYFWFMIISPFVDATCVSFACRWQSALDTWQNWQTFNAAVIAFISTLIIIHSTRISEQKNALKRRHSATAFMSSALAELCGYVEDLIKLLDEIHQEKKEFKLEFKPQVPESALKRIEKFIEESSHQDQKIIEHLVIVVNTIQVFDSRLTSILSDNVISNKNERAFYQINQCILLHALISGMFDFSRSIDETYVVFSLDKSRFRIKDCPLYMTDPEMEEYSKKDIEFKLFVSG